MLVNDCIPWESKEVFCDFEVHLHKSVLMHVLHAYVYMCTVTALKKMCSKCSNECLPLHLYGSTGSHVYIAHLWIIICTCNCVSQALVFRRCAPRTRNIGITWKLVEMQKLGHILRHTEPESAFFTQVPGRFTCTWKFEKHYFKIISSMSGQVVKSGLSSRGWKATRKRDVSVTWRTLGSLSLASALHTPVDKV